MSRRLLRFALTLIVTITTSLAFRARAEAPLDTQLNQYMDAVVATRDFNGSVAVFRDGKPLLSQGYGFADLEHGVANTRSTKFRIGSVTKQFTAMAIMILQERDRLSVSDLITKHLDEAPESWGDVTIHHLLTHTSGIASYTSMP
ncbi:MAG: serine hydrolase domain-containing protein, partial [Planctomycetota bacterium]